MTRLPLSHWLTMAALATLTLALLLAPDWRLIRLLAGPAAVLLATGFKPRPRWGGWAAVTMIPYVCIGVMETLATTGARWPGIVLALCGTIVFFAGLDSVRRSGTSLRY